VRLLIADVGMPNMDGGELAERALDLDRSLRILLMADPGDAVSTDLLAGYRDMPSVSKPVSFDQLANRLEELLGAPRPASFPPSMGPPRVRSRRRSSGHHEV
jgi:CheY-like chemotaxis protein